MKRRWNGWGREDFEVQIGPAAKVYLKQFLGESDPPSDASLEDIVKRVPPSLSSDISLISSDPEDRLRHTRGQSLPDWVAMRSGRIAAFPEGVAYPGSEEDVRSVIDYAKSNEARLIPYGGGTSVLGHITPPGDGIPYLTVDLSRMNRLLDLDEYSHLATFEAGVCGPDLENQLNEFGFTLGHFPQSFEYSTLGGWIATRSCGQQSVYYGRIEDNFAGGHIELPYSTLDLPSFPASAAGPDLKHLFLGSEGRLGIMTRAIIRIRPLPEHEGFYGVFFPDWQAGIEAVKSLAQSSIVVSMLRLSDALETEITLILSSKDRLVEWGKRGLALAGIQDRRCLLILGITGDRSYTSTTRRIAIRTCREYGGIFTGGLIGKFWKKSRFTTPYLRNTLWENGYALDTLETAVSWANVQKAETNVKEAIALAGERSGIPVLVFSHLSHVYRTGASLYFTFIFNRSSDPDQILEHWSRMKQAASLAIHECGGTISHQHGVGRDHIPYLENEKGKMGLGILGALTELCDPDALLNPGVLVRGDKRVDVMEQ